MNITVFQVISIAISSSMMVGQLLLRCLKPSVAMAVLRFAGVLRKYKHAFFSPSQWCCSASVSMVATVSTSMYLHNLKVIGCSRLRRGGGELGTLKT